MKLTVIIVNFEAFKDVFNDFQAQFVLLVYLKMETVLFVQLL